MAVATRAAIGVAALGALAFAGCSTTSPQSDQVKTADSITRAVYANDYDGTVANFDDATKKTISRAEVGELSDRMHALGDYRSLTQRAANPDQGRYEFDAAFANGAMIVQMRIDPDGKIGAFRVVPQTRHAAVAGAPAAG